MNRITNTFALLFVMVALSAQIFEPAVVLYNQSDANDAFQSLIPVELDGEFSGRLAYRSSSNSAYLVADVNPGDLSLTFDTLEYTGTANGFLFRAVDVDSDDVLDFINTRSVFVPNDQNEYVSLVNGSTAVSGDFNSDGVLDYAYSKFSFTSRIVTIRLSQENGTFMEVEIDDGYFSDPILYGGDVDNSGTVDICHFNPNSAGQIVCHLSNGDGSFIKRSFSSGPLRDEFILIENLTEGDDFPELIGSGSNFDRFGYLAATTDDFTQDAEFVNVGINGTEVPVIAKAADLDNDGDNDLVAVLETNSQGALSHTIRYFINEGDNVFTPSSNLLVLPTLNYNLADWEKQAWLSIVDINDDALPDVIFNDVFSETTYAMINSFVSSSDEFYLTDDVAVFPNPTTDGEFTVSLTTSSNVSGTGGHSLLEVTVMDQLGRTVGSHFDLSSGRVKIDRAIAGIYYVSVLTTEGKTAITKVVLR